MAWDSRAHGSGLPLQSRSIQKSGTWKGGTNYGTVLGYVYAYIRALGPSGRGIQHAVNCWNSGTLNCGLELSKSIRIYVMGSSPKQGARFWGGPYNKDIDYSILGYILGCMIVNPRPLPPSRPQSRFSQCPLECLARFKV